MAIEKKMQTFEHEIETLRANLRKTYSRRDLSSNDKKKSLAEAQFRLGLALTSVVSDSVSEGFEWIRTAFDNGDRSAADFFANMLSVNENALSFVSEIDGERERFVATIRATTAPVAPVGRRPEECSTSCRSGQ